jgi:hypothetical protein
MVLSIDELSGQDAKQLQAWLEPILDAVGAEVVVSDDADALKNVSDETGRAQQVCKSHVVRNTESLVDELSSLIRAGQDHSLEAIQVTAEQALDDLASLKEMIHSRRPEDQHRLEKCIFAMPTPANQAGAKNMKLPIGCAICLWIAGTCGHA